MRLRKASAAIFLAALVLLPLTIVFADESTHPPVLDPILTGPLQPLTQPLQPILTPVTQVLTGLTSLLTKSRDLKLLVLSADGTEPSFSSIRAVLDNMGVPYDAVILTQTGGKLPSLESFLKGNYQGIILATGNLVTCTTNPCSLALPPAGWQALDKYAVQYGVRTLAYYTFPDPRYGITWTGAAMEGGTASFLPASSEVFPDLNRTNPIPISFSWIYSATPVAGQGETTTPVLTVNGQTAAVLHKKADKREYLALTFDNNPQLLHSLAFGYGLVKWVTKGVFIGSRKAYYSPQIDDIFLASDLFDETKAACKPSGFQLDPTVDPTADCPTVRMNGGDLGRIKEWQDSVNASGPASIKVTMAFNGFGTTAAGNAPAPDTLAASAMQHRSSFFWVTHTYDHENLDCFNPVPNSGVCTPATYSQAAQEITMNANVGRQLNLVQDLQSMVTPNLSGLSNPNFLAAAANNGIRYLVMDSSKLPPNVGPNTAIKSSFQSSIVMIPRRPTNIFYNVYTAFLGVPGTATGEYNYFYGPNGISRIGGPGGPPFFTTDQTYAEIINREADFIVKNMLRGEVYPLMFHQANLVRYDGFNTLFTDLSSAVINKFRAINKLPVQSLSNSSIGQATLDRMAFNQSGVEATLNPGLSLTIKVSKSAKIPVTGICRGSCDSNGGQPISYFNAIPLLPTLVLLP